MQMIKNRYEGCQSFLMEGCLFLSLCSIAEDFRNRTVDILDALYYCRQKGYVDKNNNLSVEGQEGLLEYLTDKKWNRLVLQELPVVIPDEMYTIEKWHNTRTGYTHFKRRFMDTLVNSLTVKEGSLTAYYTYSWRNK